MARHDSDPAAHDGKRLPNSGTPYHEVGAVNAKQEFILPIEQQPEAFAIAYRVAVDMKDRSALFHRAVREHLALMMPSAFR